MMASKSFIFRFDDVEVREREFTLTKAGKVFTVEPKAFRALLFLLRNPQRLISKDELLNTVWGDASVTEGSLTRCIWLLRRTLGDDIAALSLTFKVPPTTSGVNSRQTAGGWRMWANNFRTPRFGSNPSPAEEAAGKFPPMEGTGLSGVATARSCSTVKGLTSWRHRSN
jgi:hypothetical protein